MTDELFSGVEALLNAVRDGKVLPPPSERKRLREAAGLTAAAVATALKTRAATVEAWEEGRTEPPDNKREAYRRLLQGLAEKFPPPSPTPPAQTADDTVETADDTTETAPTPARPAAQPTARTRVPTRPVPKAAAPEAAARFANGPLLVLDGDGTAYGTGGLVLECHAKTIPALLDWALHADLGAPRLHAAGRELDPLVVLTASAAERFGLPPRLEDRKGLRLPETHKVVKAIARSKWQLTRRGFGPWPRIYQPVQGGRRRCVQLAILPWDALDPRDWGKDWAPAAATGAVPAPEIAQALGTYAEDVLTPCGGGATCGIALMEALRPPTQAVQDADGKWVSAALPGSLPVPVDPAPPEPPDEHPLVYGLFSSKNPRTPADALEEEALEWTRNPELLTDTECALPYAVGIDVTMAFAAAANRLTVGLGEAVHAKHPVFRKNVPGSWLIDLSGIRLDPRLPNPFTPTGQPPTGPAWYETHDVEYAYELVERLHQDMVLRPLEAWVRPNERQLAQLGVPVPPAPWESGDEQRLARLGLTELSDERMRFLQGVPRFANGAYLDPWYQRLRNAHVNLMARYGVVPGMAPQDFLDAMERTEREMTPADRAVHRAIKATAKGGIGKLRERPQGAKHRRGEPWPALQRPTWRPDIRAALIARSRINMHRKIVALAQATGQYPIAVLTDCIVYPASGPSPLAVLPYDRAGKTEPGSFRLGVSPGMVKHEGTQQFLWAAQLLDDGGNPARLIKGTDAADDGE